jgi:hypothetical protein
MVCKSGFPHNHPAKKPRDSRDVLYLYIKKYLGGGFHQRLEKL